MFLALTPRLLEIQVIEGLSDSGISSVSHKNLVLEKPMGCWGVIQRFEAFRFRKPPGAYDIEHLTFLLRIMNPVERAHFTYCL